MRIRLTYSAALVLLFVVRGGCSQPSAGQLRATPRSPVSSATATMQSPTATAAAATLLTQSPTMAGTPSSTASPITRLEQNCLKVVDTPPQDARADGRIVFSGDGWANDSFLVDGISGKRSVLNEASSDGIHDMHVSPDGKWLAYRHDTFHPPASSLVIAAGDGKPRHNIPWQQTWRQVAGWLDNDQVLMSQMRDHQAHATNDGLIGLNPFTGEQRELRADFPGFAKGAVNSGLGWGSFNASLVRYDAALSRVIFPAEGWNLALYDVEADQRIAVISSTVSSNFTPQWSPDGQRLLIKGPANLLVSSPSTNLGPEQFELFSVSRQGDVQQLTNLADTHSQVDFGHAAWSPDGRYVAFALKLQPIPYPDVYPMSSPGNPFRLAILDTVSQLVTDYCVPNTTGAPPVWSLDARQVVIEDYWRVSKNNVFMIELSRNVAFTLDANATPIGWMTLAP